VGLASVVLVSLGAGAAYYATSMALRGREVPFRQLDILVYILAAALTTLLVALFWRSLHRGFTCMAFQLDRMRREKRIGLVMCRAAKSWSRSPSR